jgi:hypothetical protein
MATKGKGEGGRYTLTRGDGSQHEFDAGPDNDPEEAAVVEAVRVAEETALDEPAETVAGDAGDESAKGGE